MKKLFNPEDRTLAYQTFFFASALRKADVFRNANDIHTKIIADEWNQFVDDFQMFINSDYNRDDFRFEDCVLGFLEEILEKINE